MKLGDFKDVDVESTEELNSIDFSMDMDSMGILFKGFSDNLYSNKIGSIVREVASNCFDANSEVGYTGPVKISINEAMGDKSGSITFTDNGPGLSPDRIQNVYAKYFASTKRNSNN
jgi:DNA topoisomerase VI subunit B